MIRQVLRILWPLTVVVLCIAAWELIARTVMSGSPGWTQPSRILAVLPDAIIRDKLLYRALLSLWHQLSGVLLGAAVGFGTALCTSRWDSVGRLVTPVVQFLSPIPVVVWTPVAVVLFGTGQASVIVLVATASFLMTYFQVVIALEDVRKAYVEVADLYEKSYPAKLRLIFLPPATASLAAGLRLTLIIAWLVLVGTERGGGDTSTGGLGYYIASARVFGRIEHVFWGALLLAFLAFCLDRLVARLAKGLTPWDERGLARSLTSVRL